MIKSMTGFGKIAVDDQSYKLNIELRCLNSKQFDFNFRSSGVLKGKELEIRSVVGKALVRGKVELSIFYENLEEPVLAKLNKTAIKRYEEEFRKLAELGLPLDDDVLLPLIMKLPDVVSSERPELQEKEWVLIMEALEKVLEETNSFREQEGKAMQQDIEKRIDMIGSLTKRLTPYEGRRTGKIQDRIREKFREAPTQMEMDQDRFEQELIYYLEKLDITEEKIRLSNHIDYFKETLKQAEPVGKKLGFITQEMGREINTLGSKANDAEIQKIVVQMKDELEKIKEQLLNVL